MPEVEITEIPELDHQQEQLTDAHSLLNVLNVISLHIGELAIVFSSQADSLFALENEVVQLGRAITTSDDMVDASRQITHIAEALDEILHDLRSETAEEEQQKALIEAQGNLGNIAQILRLRFNEFALRRDNPDTWFMMAPETLVGDLRDVFKAIERNAGGRYGIVFDHKDKGPTDYLINLAIRKIL